MIRTNNKEISSVVAKSQIISVIRKGARVVWEAIRSCFGRGYWLNDKPWRNDDAWKN